MGFLSRKCSEECAITDPPVCGKDPRSVFYLGNDPTTVVFGVTSNFPTTQCYPIGFPGPFVQCSIDQIELNFVEHAVPYAFTVGEADGPEIEVVYSADIHPTFRITIIVSVSHRVYTPRFYGFWNDNNQFQSLVPRCTESSCCFVLGIPLTEGASGYEAFPQSLDRVYNNRRGGTCFPISNCPCGIVDPFGQVLSWAELRAFRRIS